MEKYQIQDAAVKADYTGYIPYEFVEVLHGAIINHLINGTPFKAWVNYSPSLVELFSMIDFDSVSGKYATDKVFTILKDFSSRINYREFDKTFSFEVELNLNSDQKNYEVNVVDAIDQDFIDATQLAIDLVDVDNTTELSFEVLELLKFNSEISDVIGSDKIRQAVKTVKMTTYGQIMKVKKHQLVMPDFAHKYVKKNFNISHRKDEYVSYSAASIFVDISASINEQHKFYKYISTYRLILLKYLKQFERNGEAKLTIYLFHNKIYKVVEINSITEMKEAVYTPLPKFDVSFSDVESVFRFIADKTVGKLLLLTDDSIELQENSVYNLRKRSLDIIVVGDSTNSVANLSNHTIGKTFLV